MLNRSSCANTTYGLHRFVRSKNFESQGLKYARVRTLTHKMLSISFVIVIIIAINNTKDFSHPKKGEKKTKFPKLNKRNETRKSESFSFVLAGTASLMKVTRIKAKFLVYN